MKWPSWRIGREALLALAVPALAATACEPNNAVKPGPPVLLSMTVNDQATGSAYALSDDAGPVAVPAFVHVTALFDRLLDPTGLIVIDPDGGGDLGADLATVTATPGGALSVTSIYTHNGGNLGLAFPPGPNIVVSTSPTFPSGAGIVVMLDKSKLHSKGGDPFTGDGDLADGRLSFQTQPFAATITPPDGTDATAPATVAFNNLPSETAPMHITVSAGGSPVAVTVAPDASGNPTMFTVAPATTWPTAVALVVTVDVGATDALAAPLAAAATATFMIAGS